MKVVPPGSNPKHSGAPAEARPSAAQKTATPQALDPFGIYGTRTAHRIRAARRRRIVQNTVVALAALVVVGGIVLSSRTTFTPVFSSEWQRSLMVVPAAAPALATDGQGNSLLIPTESGSLLSVDARTGEAHQIFAAAFPLRAQPLVVKDTAFVPCEDGALYVVGWRTGRRLWHHQTGASMTTRPAMTRILVPADGIPVQPRRLRSERTSSATAEPAGREPVATRPVTALPVTALAPLAVRQPETARSTVAGEATPLPAPRLVPRQIIITGNDEGIVTALDSGNGRLRWRRKAGAPIGNGLTTVAVDGRSLVLVPLLSGLATRGGIWCLDARTGVPLWRFPAKNKAYAAQLSAPAVALHANGKSGHVYCVDDGGAVVCLDLLTGRWDKGKGWKTFAQPLSSARSKMAVVLRGEPVVAGKHLVVGGNDGGVRCFEAATGRLEWTFDVGSAVRCRPRVLSWGPITAPRDVVLIGCDGPLVYGLDLQDGTPTWKFRAAGRAFAGPVVAGQNLLVLTGNGNLQKFKLPG